MAEDANDCISSMKVDGHSLNEIEFESAGHYTSILAGLNHLRHRNYLTDVKLKTENSTFQVRFEYLLNLLLYL